MVALAGALLDEAVERGLPSLGARNFGVDDRALPPDQLLGSALRERGYPPLKGPFELTRDEVTLDVDLHFLKD